MAHNTRSYLCQIILNFAMLTSSPTPTVCCCRLRFPAAFGLTGGVWWSPVETELAAWMLQRHRSIRHGHVFSSSAETLSWGLNIDCTPSPEGIITIRQLDGPCVIPSVWAMAGKMNFNPSSTYPSPAAYHMLTSGCWPLRQEEKVIKRGVITCEICIILCLSTSKRYQ